MKKQPTIVLITVDCLRADHVGFLGYERPTTPFLDALSGESLVVPQAIVAGAPTYYSFPAIMASRYPLALGRDVLGIAPDEPTLASVLKQAGYVTAAFTAANPYLASRFGYEEGFDVFRDFLKEETEPLSEERVNVGSDGWASRLNRKLQEVRPYMGPMGKIYDQLYFEYCQRIMPAAKSLDALRRFPAADVLVDEACAWLASIGDSPAFLWLHMMDPHSPYYPKEEALVLMGHDGLTPFQARYLNSYWNRSDLGPGEMKRRRHDVIELYDAGIRWVDVQVERLVRKLQEVNRWDDCVFAFTADHGEEFLDHGGRYHPPSRLMEELIHVPLLLRLPGMPKRELPKSPFSLLHLAPTLLNAVDVAAPSEFEGRIHGQEFGENREWDGIAISECVAGCTNPFRPESRMGPRVLSVGQSRLKLVLSFDPPVEHLYDLEADPGEQFPLKATAFIVERRHLLEIAREHLRQSYRQRSSERRLQARLRDLRLEWQKPEGKTLPAVQELSPGVLLGE